MRCGRGNRVGIWLWLGILGCVQAPSLPPNANVDSGSGPADSLAGSESADGEPGGDGLLFDVQGVSEVATASDTDDFSGAPPAICRAGTVWTDQASFSDITPQAFSVDVTQVVGVSLGSADIDGDLFPDLSVRSSSGMGNREFFIPGKRSVWLLHNASSGKDLRFGDVTQSSGVTATRDGGEGRQMQIVVFGDVDNDGDVDMFCGDSIVTDPTKDLFKQDSSELMLNDGSGHFSLPATASFATKELRRSLGSAAFVDYDRDGKLDLWLGYMTWGAGGSPNPDQLVQGDGAGNFTQVSAAEGIVTTSYTQSHVEAGSAPHHTWGATACDVDGDGHPDLLTTSYGRDFNTFWRGGFQGDGSVRFVDQKQEAHLDRDDNDDWTSNWNAQCWCHDHPTDAECDTCGPPEVQCKYLNFAQPGQPVQYRWNHPTDRKPYRLGGNTGWLQCADMDNDGDLDLLEGSIVHPDVGPSSDPTRILRNDGLVAGVPSFSHLHAADNGLRPLDRKNDVGDMAGAVLDFDNDGLQDVLIASSDYPGTHALLFHQQPGGTFAEVPTKLGIAMQHAHGATVADFDRDGDLDVALGHSTMRCNLSPTECFKTEEVHVFRNDMPAGNFLQVQLVGSGGSNRSAIGARVWVKAGGVTQMQELGGGYGLFAQQNDLTLHFGLGAACTIDEVKVRWPDGAQTTQAWHSVRANYLVKLTQGETKVGYPLVK